MAEILRKVFGLHRKKVTQKNSITGRNNSFPVPYLSKLEGNALLPGQSLIVRGIIVGKEEFVINLTSGPRVELDDDTQVLDDRLICIRIDIARKKVFLNACINGEWGREGSVKAKWASGDEFDIRIRCLEDEYEIFIEHKLVAKFAHYVPLSQVSHIFVVGDVELFSVSWEGKFYSVPYAADIPGNFYPGRKLYVSAMAKKNAKHFFIDFHAGQDIALRVNPRFPAKRIVANTRSEQTWGAEQRLQDDEFPFRRKRNFDLLIYCEENRFVMYINDCVVGTFEHRMSPRLIDKLTIEGDIVLQGVHLK